jgi:hypothetical protein
MVKASRSRSIGVPKGRATVEVDYWVIVKVKP